MSRKSTAFLRSAEYIVLALGLALTFLFMIPQSDMFLFSQGTAPDWKSIADYSLNYGNGRILGNLLGVFFSHHFEFAWIVCAVCTFLTIIFANKLLFKNSVYTVLPLGLVITFISPGMLSECYTVFASFTNYFIPIMVTVMSLCIYNALKKSEKSVIAKAVLGFLLFCFASSACLYSENTSIVLIVLSVLLNMEDFFKNKKFSLPGVIYFISTVIGTAIMFLIPVLTDTSHKLDNYRGVATGVSGIITSVAKGFVNFSEVFNSFTLVLFGLSFVLAFYTAMQKTDGKLKGVCVSFFFVFPFLSVLLSLYGGQTQDSSAIHLFEMFAAGCYFVFWLLTVFFVFPKEKRLTALGWTVLLLSSIVPMLLVNQHGYRTYLTTYFILLGMLASFLKEICLSEIISKMKAQYLNKNFLVVAVGTIFIFMSAYTAIQQSVNYRFYQVRTEYIFQQVEEGSAEARVPMLPVTSVSFEDEWPNIVKNIVQDKDLEIIVADANSCENADEYNAITSEMFVSTFRKALAHKFKSML